MEERDLFTLPPGLPVPEDDGAADHLEGLELPHLVLDSSRGPVDIASFGVVYVYPRSGKPGEPSLPGWDAIPGARGCTPQSWAARARRARPPHREGLLPGVPAGPQRRRRRSVAPRDG